MGFIHIYYPAFHQLNIYFANDYTMGSTWPFLQLLVYGSQPPSKGVSLGFFWGGGGGGSAPYESLKQDLLVPLPWQTLAFNLGHGYIGSELQHCMHLNCLNLSNKRIIIIIISILEPCFPLPRVGLFDKSFSKASSPLRTVLRVSRIHT